MGSVRSRVETTTPRTTRLSAVGRLKAGVSLEQAREELASLSRSMKERWPAARLSAVVAVPLHEDLVTAARGPLHLLFIAVGLVLLVACVNVANLVLARTMGRVNEFAVRLALGSGSRRIVRQMLVESLVLAGLGGLMGLALATIAIRVLRVLGADALPRLKDVGFDPVVLGFAALVTVATAIAFGVAPALRLGSHLSCRCPSSAISLDRDARAGTASQCPGGRAARARADTADWRRRAARELLSIAASGPRVSRRQCPHIRSESSERPVRRGATRCSFTRSWRAAFGQFQESIAAGGISFLPATGSYHGWNTSIVSGPRAGASVATRDGFNIQQRTVSGDFFEALNIPAACRPHVRCSRRSSARRRARWSAPTLPGRRFRECRSTALSASVIADRRPLDPRDHRRRR